MKLCVAVLVVCMALLSAPSNLVFADDVIVTEIEEAKILISGEREKVWIEETVIGALSGNGCKAGVRYRFIADQRVEKESCIEGKWYRKDGTWSLSKNDDGLFLLALWDKIFTVTLVRKPNVLELAILDLPDSKVIETTEILLRYVED